MLQPSFCNGCNGMLIHSMNLKSIAILKFHGFDYRWLSHELSKVKHKFIKKYWFDEKN